MTSRCVVSATRILAARIVGDRPATAAPRGSAAARRERIAPDNARAPAAVASAADPTRGAPSAVFRNVMMRSCDVNVASERGRARRARRLVGMGSPKRADNADTLSPATA